LAPASDFGHGSLDVVIDASSIDTGVADRDAHLRSADFFDVERYPEITFKSTGVTQTGTDRLRVDGALTIKGVTREVALDVEVLGQPKDPWQPASRVQRRDLHQPSGVRPHLEPKARDR
jgi:polyisoprenoid-binding protein YceI